MLDTWKQTGKKRGTTRRMVWVREIPIGGTDAVVMAGPCSVESREQVTDTAFAVKSAGAVILRGGAFKPRTSPKDFQGLGYEGLRLLRLAGDEADMPVITEIISEADVSAGCDHADIIQVGARNMQNFALLKRLGKTSTPVMLKRGPAATVKEWLLAADYILQGGNENVILCERGIRSFDGSLRNTLDLAAVALVKEMSDLPVIVDPSHATGKRSIIPAAARAALAIGADGLMVEVHPEPEKALSDGAQSLTFGEFAGLMQGLREPIRAVHSEGNTASAATGYSMETRTSPAATVDAS